MRDGFKTTETIEGAAARRRALASALGRAITAGELVLYYQPQFEIDDGEVCGVEALARWFRPDGRKLDTAVFIAAAEHAQLIGVFGAWVLEEACAAISQWRSPPLAATTLSVNVSALELDAQFPAQLQRITESAQFPAYRLELEVADIGAGAQALQAMSCLRRVRELGVKIAIDDFGKRGARFDALWQLPIDRLKLDRSLLKATDLRWENLLLLRSIIARSKDRGIPVIAEGVETERELLLLTKLGCPQAQGFLLGRPLPSKAAHEIATRPWGARGPRPRPTQPTLEAGYAR